ncbi:MAG: signal peptidase I [Planctomycetaceae bacterium]|jgi:signal peptidase I|nr:signal peptidase I [Planctomycetaceae bacterium]
MSDSQLTTEQPKLYHRKWVGVLCGSLLPGSAHFLAGQKKWGILWFCGYWILICSSRFIASVPGYWFGVLFFVLYLISTLYLILLLVFSWCPIPRIGCFGWISYLIFILIFNNCILYPFMISYFSRNVAGLSYGTSSSMTPTLCSSATSSSRLADVFASNAWIYWRDNPKRGDIVKFRRYDRDGKVEPQLWAKRVVGLPRETIDIDPPFVLVNGKPLIEPDIFRKIAEAQDGYNGYFRLPYNAPNRVQFPLTLADDEYFLLGDNSIDSIDSRTFGPVKRRDIKSRVIRIVFPPSRIKEL